MNDGYYIAVVSRQEDSTSTEVSKVQTPPVEREIRYRYDIDITVSYN